jgi:hypothetical protein
MLTSRPKKKGVKVIPTWQVGETDNFTSLDNGQDAGIEPAPQDEWDMEEKREAE